MAEDNGLIVTNQSIFEQIKRSDDKKEEYWSSRDLAKILQYREYRNFEPVMEKAKEACRNSGHKVLDHFVGAHEMIETGKGAKRKLQAVHLSRYACYLIIQNADPTKEIVALGQTYFTVQTRRQELTDKIALENQKRLELRSELTEQNKKLASTAKKSGVVNPIDYAVFQDHGYKGLYGGLSTKDIHRRKNLKKNQNILDHMDGVELGANIFRATQTEDKLRRENIQVKAMANQVHHEVGKEVRQTIKKLGGTMPENLPVVDNIKKLQFKKNKEIKNQ